MSRTQSLLGDNGVSSEYADGDDLFGDKRPTSSSPWRMRLLMTLALSVVLVVGAGAVYFFLFADSGSSDNGGGGGSGGDTPSTPWSNMRLPGDVIPSDYQIAFVVNLHPLFNFFGATRITVNITRATSFIVLHSRNLNLSDINVYTADSLSQLTISNTFFYDPHHYLIINMSTPLIVDKQYIISIQYIGSLVAGRSGGVLTGGSGFYATQWVDDDDTSIKYGAFTQFEAVDARRAFPCFDEPAMKATFTINMTTPSGYVALSNGANTSLPVPATDPPGNVTTTFARTERQSTYLIAFAVAPYAYTFNYSGTQPIPLRTFTRTDRVQYSQIASDAGARVQAFYERYFDIPYPFHKQDQIHVPGKGGAMENIGLVTYGSVMDYIPGQTTRVTFQGLISVIAHEIGHDWFGDIVTPAWWSHLWIKEGYARYLQYIGTEAVVHEWGDEWFMKEQFVVTTQQERLRADSVFYNTNTGALINWPVLDNDVLTPESIEAHYRHGAYPKGATLIRQMWGLLGEKQFAAGLHHYQETYYLSNAYSINHFDSLTAAQTITSYNVSKIMYPWITQMGFPLIMIDSTHNPITNITTWTLTQRRYYSNLLEYAVNGTKDTTQWPIPITYVQQPRIPGSLPIIKDTADIMFPNNPYILEINNNLVYFTKINRDQTSYFRVNYSENGWNNIINALSEEMFDNNNNHNSSLNMNDRSGLLDDVFALAQSNIISYEITLRLINYLRRETSYTVWLTAVPHLTELWQRLRYTTAADSVKLWLSSIITELFIYKKPVNWYGTEYEHINTLFINLIGPLTCRLKLNECLIWSNTNLQEILLYNNTKSFNFNWNNLIWQYGINNNISLVEQALQVYYSPNNNNQSKILAYTAIANVITDINIPRILLKKSLDITSLNYLNDGVSFIRLVCNNDNYGAALCINWLLEEDNIQTIMTMYDITGCRIQAGGAAQAGGGGTQTCISAILMATVGLIQEQVELDAVVEWQKNHADVLSSNAQTALNAAITAATASVQWTKTYVPIIQSTVVNLMLQAKKRNI